MIFGCFGYCKYSKIGKTMSNLYQRLGYALMRKILMQKNEIIDEIEKYRFISREERNKRRLSIS
jgi:hypothetical protein